jgi:hypothetical protein
MFFKRISIPVLLAVFAFALISRSTWAQTDRATIEGTVTDASGGVVSGAKIDITAVATGLTDEKMTNQHGEYRFPGIAIGVYQVVVERSGFTTKQIDAVEVRVGETRTLDIRLEVGKREEKVEVQATAEPYERSSAEASIVIGQNQIDNLPVNGRDWASLTLLAPFAQDDGGGDQRTIRFAGRARDDNNFQFDGVDAGGIQEQAQKSQTRLQISEDAIAEYRVDSALYDAEYGTQAGGQINVVTKSGSNEFHGSAFGYLRNSVFDARNFNDGPQVAPFRMGQYGMSLGGPIIKDKTFFFINYEGLRQYQGITVISAVPSPQLLNAILVTGRNGSGPSPQMCSILQSYPWRASIGSIGGCTPRFTFPDSQFSPLSPDLPAPESGDAENFTNIRPTTIHEDTWLFRVDHKFNENTTLYGRAQRDVSLVNAPVTFSNNALDELQAINHPANYFVALQDVFKPNLVNEVKVYVNRAPFHNPQASVLPYSVISNNFEQINNNQADIEVGTTFGVIDNLTLTHGKNTFKMGMEIRRVRLNQGKTESNTLTFLDDQSMIDALLSRVDFTSSWCCHKYRRTFYMPYFQDEWKVKSNITLNLGIRWEYYGVANEADNRTTVFDLNQFHGVCLGSGSVNLAPNPGPVGTAPCPRNPQLYNPAYKNFDPRVSIAWAPGMLHGKTVIRSGFGIYHGAAQNDDLNAGLESDTIVGSLTSGTNNIPLTPALQQSVPDLSGFSTAANNPRALQRHGRYDLYAEVWGLTIDEELPANFLVTAQYLGNHGVRLFSRGAVNLCITEPDPVTGACTRTLDQFYPAGNPFGSVDIKNDIGQSTYHALELSLEKRFSNGFLMQARYTWAHSINDGSVGGGESNGPENVQCLHCDKQPSVFDIRNNIAVNGVYELPVGVGKKYLNHEGLEDKLLGGWSVSGIGLWHTGHPLTVLYNVQPSQLPDGNDQTSQRPDLVPGVPLYLSNGKNFQPWINPAAFQAPPQAVDPSNPDFLNSGAVTRFGNEPAGLLRALNYWQVDFALMKQTKLTERFSLQFGVQAFNIFNHTQLGDPNASNLVLDYVPNPNGPGWITQPGSNFGIIDGTVNFNNNNDNAASPNTGTGLPRQLQFMLRLKF